MRVARLHQGQTYRVNRASQSVENDRWWNKISRKYEIKKQVTGDDADFEKIGRILKRGITIEADQRHVREVLKDPEMERANHSGTPCNMDI